MGRKRLKLDTHSQLDELCPWTTRADFVGLEILGGLVPPIVKSEIRRLEAILFNYLGLAQSALGWLQFAQHLSGHVAADEQEAVADYDRVGAPGSLASYIHFDKAWRGRTRRWEIELLAVHVRLCESCGEALLSSSQGPCSACKGSAPEHLVSYGHERFSVEDVPADSNCMFHCLLKVSRVPLDVGALRHCLVSWMEAHFEVPAIVSAHGATTTYGQLIEFEHGDRLQYSLRMRLCVPQEDAPRSNWGSSLELHAFCSQWPCSARVFEPRGELGLVLTGSHGSFRPTDCIINLLLSAGHFQILRTALAGSQEVPPVFGAANGGHPDVRHRAFIGLNRTEEALLSPLLPYIRLVKLKVPTHRPSAYGHSVITPQEDYGAIAKVIPRLPTEVAYILVSCGSSVAPELVRAGKVQDALAAIRGDPHIVAAFQFHGIEFDGEASEANMDAILRGEQVPVETVRTAMPNVAPTYVSGSLQEDVEMSDEEFNIPMEHEAGTFACSEALGECSTSTASVQRSIHVLPASAQGAPVSDKLPYLWTLAFPTLQFGHCDFNSLEPRIVEFGSRSLWFRHLINWGDGRFAGHDLFVAVAQDWVARDTVIKQSGVFMQKLGKADAEMSLEELQTKVAANDLTIMNRIQFFAQNLVGSIPYWRDVRERLFQFAEWKWFCNAAAQPPPVAVTFQSVAAQAIATFQSETGIVGTFSGRADMSSDDLYNVYRVHYAAIQGNAHGSLQLHVVRRLARYRSSVSSLPLDERARAAFVASQIAFDELLFKEAGINAVMTFRAHWLPPEILDQRIELYVTNLSEHTSGTLQWGVWGKYQEHEQASALNFQKAVCQEAQPCNPSFFITGSMAELHWPHLWTIMDEFLQIAASKAPDDATITFLRNHLGKTAVRERVIQQFGHIASRYFEKRTQLYFQIVLAPCLDLDDWFIRYEFAESRKQIHFHSVCWSRLNIGSLVSSGQEQTVINLARVRVRLSALHPGGVLKSEHARHVIYNPGGRQVQRLGPAHPARKLFCCLTAQERLTDDRDCVNVLTTHSCHGNSYCLVTLPGKTNTHQLPCNQQGVPGDKRHRCRMGFHEQDWIGRPSVLASEAGIRPANQQSRRDDLVMERDHPRVVQGSKFMRQSWRANCDLQIIVTTDPAPIADYVLSYNTKEAAASPEYKKFFLEFVAAASESTFAMGSLVRKFMLKLSGHREKPAQEILYHASGGNLFEFSRSCSKTISLSANRRVCTDRHSDKAALGDNIVDKYRRSCSGLRGMSLYEYALSQTQDKWIYVTGANQKLSWPPTESLCRALLLLHGKWVNEEDLLSSSVPGVAYPTFYEKFVKDFVFTAECPGMVRSKLMYKKFCHENPSMIHRRKHYSVEAAGEGPQVHSIGRGLQEAALSEHLNAMADIQFRGPPPGFDWSDPAFELDGAVKRFEPNVIGQLAPAANVQRQLPGFTTEAAQSMESNAEQRGAFCLVVQHALDRRSGQCSGCLELIIQGGAGTGKTFWVNHVQAALVAILGPGAAKAVAFTGNAANLVYGSTIHSAACIPVLKNRNGTEAELKHLPPVSASRVKQLEAAWKPVKYLIVDERSMLSQRLFAALSMRVCQLQGSQPGRHWGQLWGLIVVGDDAQLSPVQGKQLHEYNFSIASMNSLNLLGFKLYQGISNCIIFCKNERQAPEEVQFIELLTKAREGNVSESDLKYLNLRCTGEKLCARGISGTYGLFCSRNKDKDIFNREHLASVRGPVTMVRSLDSGCGAHLKGISNTDEFWALPKEIFIGAGLQVTITQNVSTSAGLTNGACGTILHLHYEMGTEPPALPAFILIKMECRIPAEWRGIIFPGDEALADVVALFPLTAPCGLQCCTRKQFPLAMAAASTIHRAQGRTITTKYALQIAAGDESKWPGILYTGLSRFRSINDFTLVAPMTSVHFANVRKKLSTTGRRQEMERLESLAMETRQREANQFDLQTFQTLLQTL